ncbi:MAG: MFS transporter [Bifidobacteriaceae bacterium]|jgi:OPA family glycerol-3-phosphate transporter-like MFS transporter|nr:MFS transporter [Bifidobacteriaceae bacterium]
MFLLNILRPAPDSKTKVPEGKIKSVYHWRQAGVLTATSVGYIGYYILRLAFTTQQADIMSEYGLSKGDIGMVLACFGVGYGISKFFMGILSDKSNPRFYLALGLIISALLNFALGSTGNISVMMMLMILMSVAQGMGAPASQKLIQFWWSKKNKGTAYAVWSSAHNFGAFCCVAVISMAGVLVPGWGLPGTFYIGSIVSLILAVFIIAVGADRPSTVGLPPISEFHKEYQVLNSGEVVQDDKTDMKLTEIFVKYILKNKIVWGVTVTSMSLYLVRYGVLSWIPSYLVEAKGFDKDWAKWFVGLFELCAVPGVILLATATDKITASRRVPVCIFTVVGLIVCFAGYSFSMDHTIIIICLLLMGTFIYAPLTLVGLMVNEAVPKFAVGSSTGFMGFFQYVVGEVLATALIGILVDAFGWTANIVVIGAAITLSLAVLIYLFIQEKSEKAREAQLEADSAKS